MSKTLLSNIINPEVFNPYLEKRIREISPLFTSEVLESSNFFDNLALNRGNVIKMPYFADLYGEDQVLSPDTSLSPVVVPAEKQDLAVLLTRGKAWSQRDLQTALSCTDPVKAIGNIAAEFWADKMQITFQSILKGVFGVSTMSAKVHDISSLAVDKSKLSCESFIDAMEKMGDAKDIITAVVMHSAAEAQLEKEKLVKTVCENNEIRKYFMGKLIITDDNCPHTSDTFTTYLLGKGAFAYGNGAAADECETVRDSLSDSDILISRKHYLMHPRGIKWTGAAFEASPSNKDLEASKNWAKVYDDKTIRIVKFVHKI